jgi:apolipoprotein N-acyltransferase
MRLAPWIWLVVGVGLLPFTGYQSVVPLTAWLAPIFLLRFVRTAPRTSVAFLFVFAGYALSILVDTRGGGQADSFDVILGLILIPFLRGIVFTLPYAADRIIGGRVGQWPRLLVFPAAMVSLDWLLSLFNATGTFSSPAYSQDGDLPLMQLASITGIWGVTFLIVWCAPTINLAWERGFRWRTSAKLLLPWSLTLIVVFAFGIGRLNLPQPPAPLTMAATITLDQTVADQANAGVDWVTFNTSDDAERSAARPQFSATVDQMLARSETAMREGARLVGWQEAGAIVLEEDRPEVLDRAAALARQYHAYLQLGIVVATRTPAWPFLRNQSILLDPSGAVIWTYDKTHPVLGSESLTTIRGAGVLPAADSLYGRLSTAICNDMGYPELLRQVGQDRVDVLFAPTHDIVQFAEPDAAEAHFRAIENGFTLVRATANGPSLLTDPMGRVLASQDYFTNNSGIMLAGVPTEGVATLYSRIGDVFAYLCVVILVSLAAGARFDYFQRAFPRGSRLPQAVT